ncbi:MAG: helix-turn-helix domain-containing protein [Candidatus Pacearchaeota archaeon]
MNEKLLEEIGLTKGEIKVYLSLLRLGETTTGKIIEESGMSSGKIYEILDKLIKKGLVSYIIKEKTKYFQASNPKRILDYLNEKETSLKQKINEVQKEIPLLLQLQKPQENQAILFTGFKGIQSAIFQALDELDSNNKDIEILAMGLVARKNEKFNILWGGWHNLRIKKKIPCRLIFSEKGAYFQELKKMKLAKIKFLDGITPSAIDIMDDKVLIFTYTDEPSCLFIKNQQIASSFKMFFETLWSVSKS